MAYVIGSEKGKKIAEEMQTGQTYQASDGSTWTKKSDGSVSVKTSAGESFDNAYTPSTAYSPYSKGNYSIGSNYGKQVAQDMGIGQSWTATDGSLWTKQKDGTITVDHNGVITNNAWQPSDLGIAGLQQVQAGVPYQYVQNTLDSRVNKALGDDALRQYAYDDTYWQMYNYIQDQKGKENQAQYQQWLEQYLQQNPQQTYTDTYDPQKKALLNQILNRDDFSYDVMNDPMYQQYAQMYQREGDRAMRNTLAEAAASAGGMNTYAVTAAQQANSYYGSQLNDMIPELYQLAYDKYLKDIDLKVQDLGLLEGMSDTEYARYRDTMQDWKDDRSFAYGLYNDAVQQGNWEKQFDYNSNWDKIGFENNNYWANKDYETNRADTEYNRNQQEKESAKADVEWYVSQGVLPSAELIAKAGMDEADVKNQVASVQAQMRADGVVVGNWSNGGNGSTVTLKDSDTAYTPIDYTGNPTTNPTPEPTPKETASPITSGLDDLGLGYVYDPAVVAELARAGGVYEDANGNLKWTKGWSKDNFQAKLSESKTNLWRV